MMGFRSLDHCPTPGNFPFPLPLQLSQRFSEIAGKNVGGSDVLLVIRGPALYNVCFPLFWQAVNVSIIMQTLFCHLLLFQLGISKA